MFLSLLSPTIPLTLNPLLCLFYNDFRQVFNVKIVTIELFYKTVKVWMSFPKSSN